MSSAPVTSAVVLYQGIRDILLSARTQVRQAVNTTVVQAYWQIGRLIVEDEQARRWYMDETAAQNWSSRALERQIGTLYHERLLASRDRAPVEAEARANTGALTSPKELVRDPVVLEFLGLPEAGRVLVSNCISLAVFDRSLEAIPSPSRGGLGWGWGGFVANPGLDIDADLCN